MGNSNNQELFLHLIRLGIGNESVQGSRLKVQGFWTSQLAEPSSKVQGSGSVDWEALEDLAARQGLSAVMVDGIERLPDELRPPKLVLLQWIGETLQGYEYRFDQYRKSISELAGFYNQHGYKMMLLKGYACALDWPKPEHRPCGDIDIWVFGQQQEADKALGSWFKVQGSKFEIDNSHHHHSVFEWGEFMVENHYDFVNTSAHKSSRELEKIFKNLGHPNHIKDNQELGNSRISDTSKNTKGTEIPCVEVNGENVYLPSPNLHALFLMRHAMNHFASAEITIRQLLDWAFFVEKHGKDVDWEWLEGVIERYSMKKLYDTFNAICVEDLGFPVNMFPRVQFDPSLKERVLRELLYPKYTSELPTNLVKRVIYKYRRWRANAWKRNLCYNETRMEAFWGSVWGHLLKPKSI